MVDAGPEPTYEEQKIRVATPPLGFPDPGLRAVLCRLKGPFECETECGS